MNFKSDFEFIRNISVGVAGTKKILETLRRGGANLISTDRSALSAKLWRTKVKRLRVPDLLCLRTGTRIEARAKGNLGLIMSHSPTNPDRHWNNGLRGSDLVACIQCSAGEGNVWIPSSHIGLFRVSDLEATFPLAKQSTPKSASAGSEIYLEWPTIVPGTPGRVVEVSEERIRTTMNSGRAQTYNLRRRGNGENILLTPHVLPGDTFGEGDRIIASVIPEMVNFAPRAGDAYDFASDLATNDRVTAFCAVMALGYFPDLLPRTRTLLLEICQEHEDRLVRLEAAGALARLGIEGGFQTLRNVVMTDDDEELRMEAALMLGEIARPNAREILFEASSEGQTKPEVRAAAIWGMRGLTEEGPVNQMLQAIGCADDRVALHGIVALSQCITGRNAAQILRGIGPEDRLAAGIVKAFELVPEPPIPEIIASLANADDYQKPWILFLLGMLNEDGVEPYLDRLHADARRQLAFVKKHVAKNWLSTGANASEIELLMLQMRQ